MALLLRTCVLDRFSKVIYPRKQKVVPENSRPVITLSTFRTAVNVMEDSLEEAAGTMDTSNHDILFRSSQFMRIPPNLEAPVMVHAKESGLMYAVSYKHTTRK